MISHRHTSRAGRALVAIVAGALSMAALAACGGGSGADAQSTAAAAPSVTCPAPQTTAAPGAQRTMTSGGETRTYNVWAPVGYTGTTPVPMIIDYHGTGGEPVSYETSFSSMGKEAPARGYLLIAPQATKGDATAARWRVPGTGQTPDDVAFTSDLIKDVAANYCVDPSRIYATGFSSGGAFTTYLSCQLDAFAAVAPMSGVNLSAPCTDKWTVPVVTFHGTNDETASYTGLPGGDNTTNPNAFYDADVQKTVDQWAVRNKCQPTRVDTTVVPTITKRTYNGCAADTVFYIVAGAGHTYPGGTPLPAADAQALGGQSQAIDAGKVLLDFFDAHRRTTPPASAPASALAVAGGTTGGAAGSTALPTVTVPAAGTP